MNTMPIILNMNKRNKRIKRLKHGILIFLCLIVIWIIWGLYLKLNKGVHNTLESIGYSNIEISIIDDILTKKNINILYDYPYINSLTELIVSKDFKSNNLKKYLDYYNKYKDITNKDLLYIVNNELTSIEYNNFTKEVIYEEDFKLDNINRYENYYTQYLLSPKDVVYAVNYDLDKYDIKLTDDNKIYIEEKYCILNYLDRYVKYGKKNTELSTNEVVTSVNNNLDKKEYKYKDADKNQKELILVNNYYYLDEYYTPKNLVDIDKKYGNGKLVKVAYNAFKDMYKNAKEDNVKLKIIRGYVTYYEEYNLNLLNSKKYPKQGYSDNQTGLGIELEKNAWLKDNAYKYGFILRYPDKFSKYTKVSNNNYYRYVGVECSTYLHEHDITFDEYYEYFIKNKK